ncbi:MAG: hypothetical protein ABIK23_03065 [candidate division WOR-3 bacterium]
MKIKERGFAVGGIILSLLPLFFLSCQSKPQGEPIGTTYLELAKAEVWRVPANSQAQVVGLTGGDLIVSYNDEVVQTFQDLLEIEKRSFGHAEKVRLGVLRNGQELVMESEPLPLGFIPNSERFSASLAKALEDILKHFGLPSYYDWLAAITGESFGLTVRDEDPFSWGTGGRSIEFLPNISNLTGLSFEPLYQHPPGESLRNHAGIDAVKSALIAAKGDGFPVVVVYGKWDTKRAKWGIATRVDTMGITPRVYGYTVGAGSEQPLIGEIVAAYKVRFRGGCSLEPVGLVKAVLTQALELGLSARDTGWHSGLEAYDILIKSLSQFPVCPQGTDTASECFYDLLWKLIASKESANQFFDDMKMALPEKAVLFDEVMARNRAVIARLEGIAGRGLRLNSVTNQEKIAEVLTGIAEIENEILGLYEEILAEL